VGASGVALRYIHRLTSLDMSEQKPPPTSNSLPSYRVRRRHGSWDLRTWNTGRNLHFRDRVSSQANVESTSEQHFAQVDARRSSTTGWTTELSTKNYQYGTSRSPKSGEKTVAQLRQRFEQRAIHDEVAIGFAGEHHRGHRRSKSIRSSFAPIVCREVENETSVEETPTKRAFVLPPFTSISESKQLAEPATSLEVLKQNLPENVSPMLRPTRSTGHYEFRTESANAPMYDTSSSSLSEDITTSQAGTVTSPAAFVDYLTTSEDDVKIIDFAHIRAIDLSSSPAPGQRHVRFASKSDHAPSVHYDSSSGGSTRSSTKELIDLGEYIGPPPVVRRCESRLGMYDDESDSENESPLFRPSSMYVPQPECPDGIVVDIDGQEGLPKLSVQEAESPESATRNSHMEMDTLSIMGREDSEDRTSMHNELREDLTMLPASVYTPSEHVTGHSEPGVSGIVPETTTSDEHSSEADAFTVPSALKSASLDHIEVFSSLCEVGNDVEDHIVEERVPSEAVLSSDERRDHIESRPKQKRHKFIRRLLRGADYPEESGGADQGTSKSGQNTLRRCTGRRLGRRVLFLIMWKRW
jgi:hypothetical protein